MLQFIVVNRCALLSAPQLAHKDTRISARALFLTRERLPLSHESNPRHPCASLRRLATPGSHERPHLRQPHEWRTPAVLQIARSE